MIRFVLATVLTALLQRIDASPLPASLVRAARHAAAKNPELQKLERRRKTRSLRKQLQAVDANRQLQQNYSQNYNNYYDYNFADYDYEFQWYWNQEMSADAFGFDITDYSVKFLQCNSIQTYNDALAEDESSDTVLSAQRYAVFRLCPSDSCSSKTSTGCTSGYGEYVLPIDMFLAAKLQEEDGRAISYCQYCEHCAAIEQVKKFWQDVEYRREQILAQEETYYQTWLTNYKTQQNAQSQKNGYQNNNQANQNGQNNNNNEDVAILYYEYLRGNITNSQYVNNYYAKNYGNSHSSYYSRSGSYQYQGQENAYQQQQQQQQQYQNGNNNNNNNKNYGQQYSQYNNGYQNPVNTNGAVYNYVTNPYYWQMQQNYQQYQNYQQQWSSMSTFYGKKVMNGYYDQSGAFVQEWGFFNSLGVYVSLEQEVDEWDSEMFGPMPQEWYGIYADTESCVYTYSKTCYSQYETCTALLYHGQYKSSYGGNNYGSVASYMNQQGQYIKGYYDQEGNYIKGYFDENGNFDVYDDEELKRNEPMSLMTFADCAEIEMENGNWEVQQSQYANLYKSKQAFVQSVYQKYNCYDDDEYCQSMVNYEIKKYENDQSYKTEQNQDRRYFIGPHCTNNGAQITLSVFKDEFCSVLDNETTVEQLLGYSPLNNEVSLVTGDCVSCGLSDDGTQYLYENEQQQSEFAQDGVEPMCSMLYQLSAKCAQNMALSAPKTNYQYEQANGNKNNNNNNNNNNKNNNNNNNNNKNNNNQNSNYQNGVWEQLFQSEQQALNEDQTCSFITQLLSNSYNEYGEILLPGTAAWKAAKKKHTGTTSLSSSSSQYATVNPGTKVSLILLAFACTALAAWAMFLHGALARKNIPVWRTRYPPGRGVGQEVLEWTRESSHRVSSWLKNLRHGIVDRTEQSRMDEI